MVDLVLSILFSSLLYVIFKLFGVYKVQTLYAIITNYFTASLVGTLFFNDGVTLVDAPLKPWFWGTFALGVVFISVFNIMAKSAQELGVSVTSVASKMSLVIPVLFGIALYQETLAAMQAAGIAFALIAVYLASYKPRATNELRGPVWLLLLVFLGSGLIDVALNYFQETHVPQVEIPLFSSAVFAAAGTTGVIFVLVRSFKVPMRINFKNLVWGIALGVPNYFTVYFLLRALRNEQLNSAVVFTLNNVGIVLFTTFLGILIFKERLALKNWIGLALAVISIILVALNE